jgi:hypothetical protein
MYLLKSLPKPRLPTQKPLLVQDLAVELVTATVLAMVRARWVAMGFLFGKMAWTEFARPAALAGWPIRRPPASVVPPLVAGVYSQVGLVGWVKVWESWVKESPRIHQPAVALMLVVWETWRLLVEVRRVALASILGLVL